MENKNIPVQYQPLSAWAYFGYKILFSIPIIGLICLIIFSFSDDNINRKNYARSYFCIYALLAFVLLIALICGLVCYWIGYWISFFAT